MVNEHGSLSSVLKIKILEPVNLSSRRMTSFADIFETTDTRILATLLTEHEI